VLLVSGAGVAQADQAPMLRGPHSFRNENALTASGGYAFTNQFNGVRAGVGYGYQLAGSLWFDLRADLYNGESGPPLPPPPCADCARVDKLAAVMGGLAYRLRAQIPVIPYASLTAGPVFLFNSGARGAVGMAVRASGGARYYLYEWLGLGLEVGGLLGGAVVDKTAGLSANLALLDLGISAEFQF
jgi:hypothetical protein